jgi:hypothetical protein
VVAGWSRRISDRLGGHESSPLPWGRISNFTAPVENRDSGRPSGGDALTPIPQTAQVAVCSSHPASVHSLRVLLMSGFSDVVHLYSYAMNPDGSWVDVVPSWIGRNGEHSHVYGPPRQSSARSGQRRSWTQRGIWASALRLDHLGDSPARRAPVLGWLGSHHQHSGRHDATVGGSPGLHNTAALGRR